MPCNVGKPKMPLTKDRALGNLRRLCRNPAYFAEKIEKSAELGGSQDSGFEQAMSSLGHSYLSDKAPKLLQYELGFQLLEKNQDGSRAVGIFAFKVGPHYLYAPVFFLNGDLKGHELLYLKNQDLFVPMKDSWVNYILGRKPLSIGQGVDKNLSRLGVQGPNLYQMLRSPHKYASTHDDWRLDAAREAAYFATTPPYPEKPFDLGAFIKSAGPKVYRTLLSICQAQPTVVAELDRHHPGLLEEGARLYRPALEKKAASPFLTWDDHTSTPREHLQRVTIQDTTHGQEAYDSWQPYKKGVQQPAKKRKSLLDVMEKGREKGASQKAKRVEGRTIWETGGPEVRDLNNQEKEYLLKARYVIRDGRGDDEVAAAYDVQTDLKLTNPTGHGIYEVLVRPDTFRPCLIIYHPYSNQGRHDYCTVVDLKSKKWVNIHPSRVWVRAEGTTESYQAWYDKLKEAESGASGLVMLLTSSGQGTVPFRISERAGSPADQDSSGLWEVYFRDHADESEPYYVDGLRPGGYSSYNGYNSSYSSYGGHSYGGGYHHRLERFPKDERIRFTGRTGSKITRHEGGELWVPAGIKVLSLEAAKEDKPDEPGCCIGGSDPGPLELGSLADIQYWIHNHTYPLKVVSDGREYSVTSREQRGYPKSKEAAVVELVLEHDLREKVALALVETAARKGRAECLVKSARPNMVDSAPSAPAFPEMPVTYDPMTRGQYPTIENTRWDVPVHDLQTYSMPRDGQDPLIPPDPEALRAVGQAAQTGQKEVFDTGMLSGLLKSVRDDSIIDKHLPDLLKGMNALGRLLFSLYWHQDNFADRYGKADLGTIEDGLRNSFESIGELALELKARQPNAALDESLSNEGKDMEDVANV